MKPTPHSQTLQAQKDAIYYIARAATQVRASKLQKTLDSLLESMGGSFRFAGATWGNVETGGSPLLLFPSLHSQMRQYLTESAQLEEDQSLIALLVQDLLPYPMIHWTYFIPQIAQLVHVPLNAFPTMPEGVRETLAERHSTACKLIKRHLAYVTLLEGTE